MKKTDFSRPYKFFTRILLALAVSISVTIIVLSSFLYVNFESISLSLIHNFIKDNLSQVSYSATFMNNSAKSLALQMYFDPVISKLMFSSSIDVNEVSVGLRRMNSYRNVTPYIHSVYIYNRKLGSFYSTLSNDAAMSETVFFDKQVINLLNNYRGNNFPGLVPRLIPNTYNKALKDKASNVYTLIFNETFSDETRLDEAIVLNISEEWLRSTIKALSSNPDSDTFIINNEGVTMISDSRNNLLKDISDKEYIRRILSSKKSSGYFIENAYGKKSLITYVSSGSNDWKFINITPYNNIVSKINRMKLITFIAAFVILIIGILVSLFTSRKLYKPIDNVIARLSSLETEKRNKFHIHKQEFIRNVLFETTEINMKKTLNEFNYFGITLDPETPFALLLLKIDRYSDFCTKFNSSDRSLFKFGIMNISSEICSNSFKNEPVDVGDDHIMLIINVPKASLNGLNRILEELTRSIQTSVHKHLNISLSVTASSTGSSLCDIPLLYRQCVEDSQYRLFYGESCFIYPDLIRERLLLEYTYPVQKEKLFTDALMLGRLDDMKRTYVEIINSSMDHSLTVFQSTLFHLAIAIFSAVDSIRKTNSFTPFYSINSFVSQINGQETIEDINNCFFKVFETIVAQIETKKNNRHNELINTVMEIINERYRDQNLSRENIADAVNMSPVYLGSLFKKITSKSIADYISQVRVENAKQLLKTTNLSIGEIAEKTGFIGNVYFYTVFKKMNGITPNEYRQGKSD